MKLLAFVVCLLAALSSHAQTPIPIDSTLGESIVFIKGDKFFAVELETTLFKPEGAGPFPIVVLNHGKEGGGSNRFQARNRPIPAVREFLQRGYAVVAPMRQGFSRSGGAVVGDNCNIAANGDAQAEDVIEVVKWLKAQTWADTTRMLMMGQSHGGLTTMAYAKHPDVGFKFFVNFAGGLKFTNSNCLWQLSLKEAFERYGAKTKAESIWFYGDNDSFFPPEVINPAYKAYVDAGGKAEMVAFGTFGSDAHGMFGSYSGLPIWWSKVESKLAAVGMPTKITYPEFGRIQKIPVPPKTQFAPLDSVDKVPFVSNSGRIGYQSFLTKPLPRAFAIAPSGAWTWTNGGDDPLKRALDSCNAHKKGTCKLYAVDNDVVWDEVTPK